MISAFRKAVAIDLILQITKRYSGDKTEIIDSHPYFILFRLFIILFDLREADNKASFV